MVIGPAVTSRRRSPVWPLLLAVASCEACDDRESNRGGDPIADAGNADAGDPCALDALEKRGFVWATSSSYLEDGGSVDESSMNTQYETPPSKGYHESRSIGPCIAMSYFGPAFRMDGGARCGVHYSSAGVVRVEGLKTPATFRPHPRDNGSGGTMDGQFVYESVWSKDTLWKGDELVTVRATGDMVPPFEGTVRTPKQLNIVQTPFPEGSSVSGAADAELTWMALPAGSVVVDIEWGVTRGSSERVLCLFDATSDSGIIPRAVFERFPPDVPARVVVWSAAQTAVRSGEWTIDLKMWSLAVDGAGKRMRTVVKIVR